MFKLGVKCLNKVNITPQKNSDSHLQFTSFIIKLHSKVIIGFTKSMPGVITFGLGPDLDFEKRQIL